MMLLLLLLMLLLLLLMLLQEVSVFLLHPKAIHCAGCRAGAAAVRALDALALRCGARGSALVVEIVLLHQNWCPHSHAPTVAAVVAVVVVERA